jgi:acyl carrier protein
MTPTQQDVLAREVRQMIAHELDVPERAVVPDARIGEDLGADSLGIVSLILAFEEAYLVDITDEEVERVRTTRDLVDCVIRHVARGPQQHV